MSTSSNSTSSRPQIRALATPNPLSMKFFLPQMLTENGFYYEFTQENAKSHPLPEALFKHFDVLRQLFVMQNFITFTKIEEAVWQEIVPQVQSFLINYLEKKKLIQFTEEASLGTKNSSTSTTESPQELGIEARIEKILEEYVRPAVARDGGAISLDSYEDGLVRVRLRGACSGCPSATVTLKAGVERLLKSMLPEIKAVEAVEEV